MQHIWRQLMLGIAQQQLSTCACCCRPAPTPGVHFLCPVQDAVVGGGAQQAKGVVKDSLTRLRGGGAHDAALVGAAKELRKMCTGHPDWTMDQVGWSVGLLKGPPVALGVRPRGPLDGVVCCCALYTPGAVCADSHQSYVLALQVKECLRLAAKGEKYEPKAAAGAVAGQQRAAGGAGKAARGGGEEGQGAAAGGELGQRQEQQLHEDEEVLRQGLDGDEGGAEGTADQAGAAADALLDEGRLRGQLINGAGAARLRLGETHGTVKRLDEGDDASLGASRLGLFGVLLWAATLAVAFFLLPWAKRAVRRNGGLLPSGAAPYRGKGRDD